MAQIDRQITDMEGDSALPRDNGELLFEAPWEARAFALAVALNESGRYPWRDFSAELAAQIRRAEEGGEDSGYYERWLRSLESLLLEKGLVGDGELQVRKAEIAAADEHGHDH